MYEYIENFKNLGFGMFVHFGLYSVSATGEWSKLTNGIEDEEYEKLAKRFKVKKSWAKDLVKTAKLAGCKYITLTTRHHDGFSLYDTKGLSDFDSLHTPTGRDLVREFVDECNKAGIVPFFYHTLLDWRHPDYKNNFPKYIDYLVRSIEILCSQYGKIGGLWFDGMWDKPNDDWQEDRIYGTIRKYQPEAMIINNTGLGEQGKLGHPEIDSVTFERGKPFPIITSGKPIAGEVCEILNDHWGYAKADVSYKGVKDMIEELLDCRQCGCNFLLNVGPVANGSLRPIDKAMLELIGQWIRFNKNFIYNVNISDVTCENAMVMKGDNCYYVAVKTAMGGNLNVVMNISANEPTYKMSAKIKSAKWLDDGSKVEIKNGNIIVGKTFDYGTSAYYRVAKVKIK